MAVLDDMFAKMHQVTHLGRVVDPRYWTNAVILVMSAVAAAGYGLYRLAMGTALLEAGVLAVLAGGGVFAAWVISREFSPDHEVTSLVAGGVALVGAVWLGPMDVFLIPVAVVALRLMARTTGLSPLIGDYALVAATAGLAAAFGGWPLVVVAVAGLVLNALWEPDGRGLAWSGAALVAVVAAIAGAVAVGLRGGPLQYAAVYALPLAIVPVTKALVALLGMWVTPIGRRATCDATGAPVESRRVRAAQVLGLLMVLAFYAWTGNVGLASLWPLWAALVVIPGGVVEEILRGKAA